MAEMLTKVLDSSLLKEWCTENFSAALPVGTIVPINCTVSYIPSGMWPCDGTTLNATIYPTLWESYLTTTPSKLNTCSFDEFEADILEYGQCVKFGVDTTSGTFRVPYIKDGGIITNALLTNNIGASYNESLPNITGECGGLGGTGDNIYGTANGAFAASTSTYTRVGSEDGRATRGSYMNASRSSSTYQSGAIVQMANVRLRYFIQLTTSASDISLFDWSAIQPIVEAKQDALTFSSDFVVESNMVSLNQTPTVPTNGNYINVAGINATARLGTGTANINISNSTSLTATEKITNISNIKKVAYTRTDSLAIGLDGELYLAGTTVGTTRYYNRLFFTQKWVDVAASYNGFILLDDTGRIYTMGTQTAYQLGLGTNNNARYAPTLVETYYIAAVGDVHWNTFTLGDGFANVNIVQVAACMYGLLALDDAGNMYISGNIGAGVYGVGNTNGNLDGSGYFTRIPYFANIKYICGGGSANTTAYWLAIDDTGDVWGCGDNGYYKLGDGTQTDIYTPTVVLPDCNITKVSCSSNQYSLAMSSTGKVYYTGIAAGWINTTTNITSWTDLGLSNVIDIQANFGKLLVMYDDGTDYIDNSIYEMSYTGTYVGRGKRFNDVLLQDTQYMMSWISST